MHPDLERLLSEDEAARTGVEAARSRARVVLEAVQAELARQRDTRLHDLRQDHERSVARILADGDDEVARRRAQRETRARDESARTAPLVDRGVELWIRIIRNARARDGP